MKKWLFILPILLLCEISFAQAAEEWRNDELCGTKLPDLKETEINGCDYAYCGEILPNQTLCSCSHQDEKLDNPFITELTLKRKNMPDMKWREDNIATTYISEHSIQTQYADLDGNKTKEIIVATLGGLSNGMGVSSWAVRVIDGDKISKAVYLKDYGTVSFLTRKKNDSGCKLLASQWLGGSEPYRGWGLYLTGKWYDYSADHFSETYERPTIYRRYLYSFEKERNQASKNETPLLWYKSPKTKEISGPDPWRSSNEN